MNTENKRKGERRLLGRLFSISDLPQEECPGTAETVITIFDRMQLRLSRCRRLICFRDDLIFMRAGRYELTVVGEGLTLCHRSGGSVEVDGLVTDISLRSACDRRREK